jgi:hypothetical protein
MKSAFMSAVNAFVKQVKQNHLDYCKSVVAKAEKASKKAQQKINQK